MSTQGRCEAPMHIQAAGVAAIQVGYTQARAILVNALHAVPEGEDASSHAHFSAVRARR